MFIALRRTVRFVFLLAFQLVLSAQTALQPTLSLSPGSVVAGQAVDLEISLGAPSPKTPATIRWTLSYPTASVEDVSVNLAPLVPGKAPFCAVNPGTAACILTGLNQDPIPAGTIAVLRVTTSRSAAGSINLVLSGQGAGPNADPIPMIGAGNTIAVVQPVLSLTSLACSPATVAVGQQVSCTVGLSSDASSNTTISLISSSAAISMPAVAVVPAGASSISITGTAITSSSQPVVLSALLNGIVQRSTLSVTTGNPVPLTLSVSPANTVAGSGSFVLTVSGSGFTSSSVVQWNNLSRPTTLVNANALTASIAAADIGAAGTALITVFNPSPGGGTSGAVSFTVSAAAPSISQVENGASFTPGPIAPGSFVAISGRNFADQQLQSDLNPLPTTLSNVSVSVNNLPAPIKAVSPNQINALLPWNLLPAGAVTGTAQVILTNSAGKSAPVQIQLAATAPGIFYSLIDPNGVLRAAAVNGSDGSLPLPVNITYPGYISHPATVNDPASLILFATGLGAVTNQPPDGQPGLAAPPYSTTLQTPEVLVGGVPAQIVFSGLSPQFAGVYQVNLILQPGTPTGDAVPLQIRMNGITTSNQIRIAVSD